MPKEYDLDIECKTLRTEVAVLENLIQRYQAELLCTSPVNDHNDRPQAPCSHALSETEYVVEQQHLYPHDKAAITANNLFTIVGTSTSFIDINLPSQKWQWISDWTVEIHQQTDESGWMYASQWRDITENIPKYWTNHRNASHIVRRRRWKRERMFVGTTGLPFSSIHQKYLYSNVIHHETQLANEKLTQQLYRTQELLNDSENRVQMYEKQIKVMQEEMNKLKVSNGPNSARLHEKNDVSLDIPTSQNSLDIPIDLLNGTDSTIDVQLRHSLIVEECQKELNWAVDEFNDLIEEFKME